MKRLYSYRYLIGCIGLILAVTLLLRNPIQQALFKRSFLASNFNKELRYDKLTQKGWSLTLKGPKFRRSRADVIILKYGIDWGQLAWKIQVIVEEAMVDPRDLAVFLKLNDLNSLSLQIDNGYLISKKLPFKFILKGNGGDFSSKYLDFQWTPSTSSLAYEIKGWDFSKVPMEWDAWKLFQGQVTGKGVIRMTAGGLGDSSGELWFDKLNLYHLVQSSSLRLDNTQAIITSHPGGIECVLKGEMEFQTKRDSWKIPSVTCVHSSAKELQIRGEVEFDGLALPLTSSLSFNANEITEFSLKLAESEVLYRAYPKHYFIGREISAPIGRLLLAGHALIYPEFRSFYWHQGTASVEWINDGEGGVNLRGKHIILEELDNALITSAQLVEIERVGAGFDCLIKEGKLGNRAADGKYVPLIDFFCDKRAEGDQLLLKARFIDGSGGWTVETPSNLANFYLNAHIKPQAVFSFLPEGIQKHVSRSQWSDGSFVLSGSAFLEEMKLRLDGDWGFYHDHENRAAWGSISGLSTTLGMRLDQLKWDNLHIAVDAFKTEFFIEPFIYNGEKVLLFGDWRGWGDCIKGGWNGQFFLPPTSLETDRMKLLFSWLKGTFTYDPNAGGLEVDLPVKQAVLSPIKSTNNRFMIDTHLKYSSSEFTLNDLIIDSSGSYLFGQGGAKWNEREKGWLGKLSFERGELEWGSLRKLMRFLAPESPLRDLPLEGKLSLLNRGVTAKFLLNSERCEATVSGESFLSEGTLGTNFSHTPLKEVSAHISFQYPRPSILFEDVVGQLDLGGETYQLACSEIAIPNLQCDGMSFDLWIGDRSRDLVRLAGSARVMPAGKTALTFDPKRTHLGSMEVKIGECFLKNWSSIERVNGMVRGDLSQCWPDIKKMAQIGLSSISDCLANEVESIKYLSGTFQSYFHYGMDEGKFSYQISGKQIKGKFCSMNTLQVDGAIQEDHWVVDRLTCDEWSFSADMFAAPDRLKFNFLGARYGDVFLAGMNGILNLPAKEFHGRVNLLDIKIPQLMETKKVHHVLGQTLPQLYLKGELKGTGSLAAKILPHSSHIKLKSDLLIDTKNVSLGNLQFKDCSGVNCSFESDKGLLIEGLKTVVFNGSDEKQKIGFNLGLFRLLPERQNLLVRGLQFTTTTPSIDWVAKAAFLSPGSVSSWKGEILHPKGLSGSVDLDLDPSWVHYHLRLADGNYQIQGQTLSIKQFHLLGDHQSLQASALVNDPDYPIVAELFTQPGDFKTGTVVLSETDEDQTLSGRTTIDWELDEEGALLIQGINGKLAGCEFHLSSPFGKGEKTPFTSAQLLKGEVYLNFEGLYDFLPAYYSHPFESLRLGAGYCLKGNWKLGFPLFQKSAFEGECIGSLCEVGSYCLDRLYAKLSLQPSECRLSHLKVEDRAGRLEADHLLLAQQQSGQWRYFSPMVRLRDFQLDNLQGLSETVFGKKKSLTIPQAEVQDVSGNLGDLSSCTAKGSVEFIYSCRKEEEGGIRALSKDLLKKVGLDAESIYPAIGGVEFEVGDGAVYLTKLKDVYSEGKGTKFTLASGSGPSSIDFQGDLNLHIRVKQQKLLLKMTDKTVFLITGNLKRPVIKIDE